MLQSFLSITKIPDLWKRVKYTLLMIAIYRLAAQIPSPFLDLGELKNLMDTGLGAQGVLQFVSMFTGGAFEQMTVLALGIMPYITASIIIQMLGFVFPAIERLMKEGDAGRRVINDWTRYGTILICMVQSIGVAIFLLRSGVSTIPDHPVIFTLFIVLALTTGSTFLMWLGEKMSENGIGNGISLLITISIIAYYPFGVASAFLQWRMGNLDFAWIVGIVALGIATLVLCVLMTQGQRKIPIQHAKRMVGRRMMQSQTTYLPLRINTAGVIPVIFSGSLLAFPSLIFSLFRDQSGTGFIGWLSNLMAPGSSFNLYNVFDSMGLSYGGAMYLFRAFNFYTFAYCALTIAFCFFYTAITFNPVDIAENLKRSGAFVPGRRPGKPTSDYIDYVLMRITVVGSIFLTLVAIVPQVVSVSYNIDFMISQLIGGTGIIIIVGVMLDTMRQIESHLIQRHYEGFMKKGRLRGRS